MNGPYSLTIHYDSGAKCEQLSSLSFKCSLNEYQGRKGRYKTIISHPQIRHVGVPPGFPAVWGHFEGFDHLRLLTKVSIHWVLKWTFRCIHNKQLSHLGSLKGSEVTLNASLMST